MTLGYELRALNAMKSSRLWMISTIQGLELKTLNFMNSKGEWMI